jgi:hypothetical protein
MTSKAEIVEVTSVFNAMYPALCALNRNHKIKPNDLVAKIRRLNNPMLPLPGVVCKDCFADLPRAKD